MNNIKRFRKEQGITLQELAKLSNCSVGYMCHLEKGTRSNPSHIVMQNIAKALNHTIAQVFFSED